jgi:hypothetical protein
MTILQTNIGEFQMFKYRNHKSSTWFMHYYGREEDGSERNLEWQKQIFDKCHNLQILGFSLQALIFERGEEGLADALELLIHCKNWLKKQIKSGLAQRMMAGGTAEQRIIQQLIMKYPEILQKHFSSDELKTLNDGQLKIKAIAAEEEGESTHHSPGLGSSKG